MASPLNRLPPGLLDFFGIKAGGWGPREMAQQLQPGIDLFRWYMDENSQEGYATSTAIAASASGGLIPITSAQWLATAVGTDFANGAANTVVPQDETWFILEAGVDFTFNNAGNGGDFALVSTLAQRSIPLTDAVLGWTSGAAGGINRVGKRVMTKPYFVARGGSTLALYQFGTTIAAGTVDLACNVRIVRMKR